MAMMAKLLKMAELLGSNCETGRPSGPGTKTTYPSVGAATAGKGAVGWNTRIALLPVSATKKPESAGSGQIPDGLLNLAILGAPSKKPGGPAMPATVWTK